MGIKNINTLIKKYANNAFFDLPITELTGKRVAIDGNNWMYTNMAISRRKIVNQTDLLAEELDHIAIQRHWLNMAVDFAVRWLDYGIVPVFVFDGKPPQEKNDTCDVRNKSRNAALEKMKTLYAKVMETKDHKDIDELKKVLSNYVVITEEQTLALHSTLSSIGIPITYSNTEGERLCASLCLEGKVAAVFSMDTDTLTHGCPLLITKFSINSTFNEDGVRIHQLECVRLDTVLDGLQLSYPSFIDLCIMCGCDFNTNMPGYAAIKSYALIKEYGSIDLLPKSFDIKCLNHHACRSLFSHYQSDYLSMGTNLEFNRSSIVIARDIFDVYGVSGKINNIMNAINKLGEIKDGHVDSLNLTVVSKYEAPVRKVKINIQ